MTCNLPISHNTCFSYSIEPHFKWIIFHFVNWACWVFCRVFELMLVTSLETSLLYSQLCSQQFLPRLMVSRIYIISTFRECKNGGKAITSNCIIGFNQCFFQFCDVATIAITYKIILSNFAYKQKIDKLVNFSILLLLLAAYWSYRVCWFPFEN
jgi:hypothetical protein